METLTNNGIHFINLITLSEVKSISVFTLRKFAKHEGMPHERVGRKILVNPIAFDEWFLRRKKTSFVDNAKTVNELIEEVFDGIA